ncbi:diaminopimelate decarboxylase [Salarchaeum sp. JOR-1]|uniref:diaminopimelate decarboxylase n=1 Tax=Salarchaeum sp. JOR-1 TaxID=2599399 RepID=UPI001198B2F0|nr:diaminopimelate decarboxylase [Salarchaeum sp. JOR-1]QDX39626.1 diaminopimelate decarboxylase [Salarchaeum sp. JOR-1]
MSVRRLADWADTRLRRLADEHGTPLYVHDHDRVRENYRRLSDAFPDADVLYAVKANAGRHVLTTLREAGAGAECASAGELKRALNAGFDPSDVHYTPVNPPARDLDYAVDRLAGTDATVTVGSADTLDRLAERGFAGRVLVRVHPAVGAGHSAEVATGADAKFGVARDRVHGVLADADDRGFDVRGLHAHTGSGLLTASDRDDHRTVVETLAGLVAESPVTLDRVDVGGGFGVPYRESEPPLDLDAVATATRDALAGLDVDLAIEPGRYLVADAGVLLATVNTTKETDGDLLAGVDAGMTTLIRPALYDAYHAVRSLAPDAADRITVPTSVVGPVCESADVLAEGRDLPRVERGDTLAVGNAGAYGVEMANTYNSRPRPAVVALDGADERLVRRRETLADLTTHEA